jgi:hypothetical protein
LFPSNPKRHSLAGRFDTAELAQTMAAAQALGLDGCNLMGTSFRRQGGAVPGVVSKSGQE